MTNKAMTHAADWGTVLPFAGYELPRPSIWELYEGEWVEFPDEHPDIYSLIERYRMSNAIKSERTPVPDAFAVFTTGWAAPVEECDPSKTGTPVAPSKSENRRRVALCCVYSIDGSRANSIRFEDHPADDLTEDGSGASGALSDALDECAAVLWGVRFVRGLALSYIDADTETRQRVAERVASLMSLLGLDD